jgi:tRNA threonylcarbamoyladenosine biosynthesis protein TsaE
MSADSNLERDSAPGWLEQTCRTFSEQETATLASRFGESLRAPCVVLLYGDLGVGKTAFTRGLVAGLGVSGPDEVRSPSFTLVNRYPGRSPIYHIDLYRLNSLRDLESIGLDEIVSDEAFVVVEWAEKLPTLPPAGWRVSIADLGGESREVEFRRIP